MSDEPTDRELLWRQYELHVGLYKFYLETIIKFNLFFYLITGGILTFYFANPNDQLVKYSLVFPALLSFAFSAVAIYAAKLMGVVRLDIFRIRDSLKLNTAPDVNVLAVLLRVFAAVFFIGGVVMIVLVAFHKPLAKPSNSGIHLTKPSVMAHALQGPRQCDASRRTGPQVNAKTLAR